MKAVADNKSELQDMVQAAQSHKMSLRMQNLLFSGPVWTIQLLHLKVIQFLHLKGTQGILTQIEKLKFWGNKDWQEKNARGK